MTTQDTEGLTVVSDEVHVLDEATMTRLNQVAVSVEQRLRVEAVERVIDVLHEFVRDGRCDLLVRVAGLSPQEFAEVEADEARHPNGLPMKREWLAGSGSHLIVEYVAADGEGSVTG